MTEALLLVARAEEVVNGLRLHRGDNRDAPRLDVALEAGVDMLPPLVCRRDRRTVGVDCLRLEIQDLDPERVAVALLPLEEAADRVLEVLAPGSSLSRRC